MTKDIYTVKDIADQMQVHERTVRQLIHSGGLPATKVCNKWVVSAENLQNLISQGKGVTMAHGGEST